jgi:hypothetical protein
LSGRAQLVVSIHTSLSNMWHGQALLMGQAGWLLHVGFLEASQRLRRPSFVAPSATESATSMQVCSSSLRLLGCAATCSVHWQVKLHLKSRERCVLQKVAVSGPARSSQLQQPSCQCSAQAAAHHPQGNQPFSFATVTAQPRRITVMPCSI